MENNDAMKEMFQLRKINFSVFQTVSTWFDHSEIRKRALKVNYLYFLSCGSDIL